MAASAQALAQRIDREYALESLKWTMDDWYPVAGRYLYADVTAVDTAARRATGTGPDGQTVRGRYGDYVPAVGERWRAFRIAGGQYVFEDLA